MKMKGYLRGILCIILMAVMIPFFGTQKVAAADGDGSASTEGIVTTKTAELTKDGTYQLDLSAYVTGNVTTSTQTTHMPEDITIVLDRSGSMSDEIKIGEPTTVAELNEILDSTYGGSSGTYYMYGPLNYKAPIKYNSGKWQYQNAFGSWKNISDSNLNGSGILSDYSGGIYIKKIDALKIAAKRFLDSVYTDATTNSVTHRVSIVSYGSNVTQNVGFTDVTTGLSTLKSAVDSLSANGATYADAGMLKAYENLSGGRSDALKVAVLFTDGAPTHSSTSDDFSKDSSAIAVASATISAAHAIKAEEGSSVTINYLNNNDKSATKSATGLGGKVFSVILTSGTPTASQNTYMSAVSSNYPDALSYTSVGTHESDKYYLTAATSDDLNNAFETISKEIAKESASIDLNKNACVYDGISQYFDVNSLSASNVTVKVQDCTGEEDGKLTFGKSYDPTAFTPTVTVDPTTKTIKVSGFDFGNNWCGKRADGTYKGQKLVITITGLVPTDEAVDMGTDIPTNTGDSGIYKDTTVTKDKAVTYFNIPKVNISKKYTVLDYAKTAVLNTNLRGTNGLRTSDSYPLVGSKTGTYGSFLLSGSKTTYTPNTMKWDGTDSVLAFGMIGDDYAYDQLTVMPADNVYYEDTFTTKESTTTSSGRVGITYTGDCTISDKEGENTNDSNNDVQGWVESLADDKGNTDGTVAKLTAGATAEFSFTGQGCDVYSYIDNTTGTVLAEITGPNDYDKMYIANSYAANGPYYEVPVLSFQDLPYGTYTVTIYVTSAADETNYYIDGIRVYNPIASSTTVTAAYGDNGDANAVFKNIRDYITSDSKIYVDTYENAASDPITVEEAKRNVAGAGDTLYSYDASPYNEVYLSKGCKVVFNISGGTSYYVGMKALKGSTTAAFNVAQGTAATASVSHTSDLYYKVTPSDGKLVIENTGDNVLALTKIKVCGVGAGDTVDISALDEADAIPVLASFASMNMTTYEPVTDDSASADDTYDETIGTRTPTVKITSSELTAEQKAAAKKEAKQEAADKAKAKKAAQKAKAAAKKAKAAAKKKAKKAKNIIKSFGSYFSR